MLKYEVSKTKAMSKPSIPLLALRTFVEVGNYGSVKTAAQVLNVTPGAVSQQIRLLEERVGTSLLIREPHGVRMTQAGAYAHPVLFDAFAQIEKVVDTLDVCAPSLWFARLLKR